jgi:hypothetical protein
MIRVLLILAVIALGADAVLNDGAITKAAWDRLTSLRVTLEEDELWLNLGDVA